MRKIDQLLSEYGESHQNATNKFIHWICVPAIFFSIVALIASIPSDLLRAIFGDVPLLNWASVLLVLVMIYYLSLSVPLSIGMLFFSFVCLVVINALTKTFTTPLWLIALIIFVVAWVGQFYGHKVEGKKPSFFKDIQFLLIGPAWLMHFIFKKVGVPY
ncbi:MAG TPA: Mpo1-like protein [Cyclobacteriaceae bacterium]|jgi:uncharacterized membrane protein YGL010W|nr:Mpo1-like protein [Cyclobacteriaceae bacterium]